MICTYFKINFTKIFVKMISLREKNIRSDKIEPRKYIRLFFSVKTAIHHKNITQEAARWGSFLAKFWVVFVLFYNGSLSDWWRSTSMAANEWVALAGTRILGQKLQVPRMIFFETALSSKTTYSRSAKYSLVRSADHSRGSISLKTGRIFSTT